MPFRHGKPRYGRKTPATNRGGGTVLGRSEKRFAGFREPLLSKFPFPAIFEDKENFRKVPWNFSKKSPEWGLW